MTFSLRLKREASVGGLAGVSPAIRGVGMWQDMDPGPLIGGEAGISPAITGANGMRYGMENPGPLIGGEAGISPVITGNVGKRSLAD
ncbi:unnamed protein product [Strongylus vulgaris]|uniref:Uncharacterized protein n=1 Tax=Strongylus vulgaris TaxID=40348 RepID=A0A3P7JR82_STRVU|nr:unnamed protein product [Strongylus vulgaris]